MEIWVLIPTFGEVTGEFAALRPATLLKKTHWHRCFPENFAKFSRTPFLLFPPKFRFEFRGCQVSFLIQKLKLLGIG